MQSSTGEVLMEVRFDHLILTIMTHHCSVLISERAKLAVCRQFQYHSIRIWSVTWCYMGSESGVPHSFVLFNQ